MCTIYLIAKGDDKMNFENLKKNRVRNYIKEKYGKKGFTKEGNLKLFTLLKALKNTKNESLKKAINLAINFKKMKK
jgi:hypothetical protein